jgi:hypothetical protein
MRRIDGRYNGLLCFGFVLSLLLSCAQINAQVQPEEVEIEHALYMQAVNQNGKVLLRWAPTNAPIWKRCNQVGYHVTRITLVRDGQVTPIQERLSPVMLTDQPLRPWQDQSRWEALMDRNDHASVAAQALFGEQFALEAQGDKGLNETLINAQAEELNRFSFGLFAADQSYEVAGAMGLALEDENLKAGENYLYRVFPAENIDIPVDTGFVYVQYGEPYLLPKLTEFKADFSNLQVMLSWNVSIGQRFYTSYQIEQSFDGTSWGVRNTTPFVPIMNHPQDEYAFFADTLPFNNRPVFYRVRGKTIFDSYGPYSDIVQGSGKDPLPSFFPEIKGVLENDKGHMDVQWVFNESEEDKIQGFHIYRAKKIDGPYSKLNNNLLPSNQRYYTDSFPLAVNYYKMTALDPHGRPIESFPAFIELADETPPAPPLNVRGRITLEGDLVIVWDKNTEADFMGNRIYISNHPNAEFTQITRDPVTTGFYIHRVTLNTLTENVYVKVNSLDYHHNPSKFSKISAISRPDTIAPARPSLIAFDNTGDGIRIDWTNSPSSDVIGHDLFRRKLNDSEWKLVRAYEFPKNKNITFYLDTNTLRGEIYEYKIEAFDEVNLRTASNTLQVQMIDNFVRPDIGQVNTEVDRRQKTVTLKWNYPIIENLEYFQIYRSISDHIPVTYAKVSLDEVAVSMNKKKQMAEFEFIDNKLKMNTEYRYRIKAKCSNGAQSPLSELVTVKY